MKGLFWLDTGIFPATVMLSHGYDYKGIQKALKNTLKKKGVDKKQIGLWSMGAENRQKEINESKYLAFSVEVKNSKSGANVNLYYIVLKKKFKFTDYDYCILAHEILHICQFFLPQVLDREREIEAECYLHTHLMSQCLKVLRSKK